VMSSMNFSICDASSSVAPVALGWDVDDEGGTGRLSRSSRNLRASSALDFFPFVDIVEYTRRRRKR